jgi:glycosyltransferase involved in cell wall biosynthesis
VHVAVFLQYYHTPDCPTAARPYALVERLAREHEVTVVTTRAWREKRLTNRVPWAPSGARLVEFDVPYDNTMSSTRRLQAFLEYAARAVRYGLQMPRPDVILGSSPPLTAATAAAAVAHLRGIPWIFEVQDLWPEFPIQMGVLSEPGVRHVLYGLESVLYRTAEHVVTRSQDMTDHVRTIAPRSDPTTIEYGTDLKLVDDISNTKRSVLRRRFSLDRRFLVLYAGSFGRANALPTLLDAAKHLENRSDVLFAFAGQGYHEPTVRRASHQLDHVRHLPPLPYPDALALFSLADVSLVSFLDRPVLATNSPGKFYDSLATGTPVVVTNPGWTKRFVDAYECGCYVPPESPSALADRLRTLLDVPERLSTMGQNARAIARKQFDRAQMLDRYATLVDRIGRLESEHP